MDPLGIGTGEPHFSWWVEDRRRGARQRGWQVVVASSPEKLANNRGDFWDSGKVVSEQTVHIPFGGKLLVSKARAWWKVRVWDQNDGASDWSEPAGFSVGLLNPEDWTAEWISAPDNMPGDAPFLRTTVELDGAPEQALAYVGTLGLHELYINGRKVGDDVLSPAVCQFDRRSLYLTHEVSPYLRRGTNSIGLWLGRGWYRQERKTPGVAYSTPLVRAQIDISGGSGKPCTIRTDATWKAHPSPITEIGNDAFGGECYDNRCEIPGWNTVDCDESDWSPVAIRSIHPHTASAQMVQRNRVIKRIPAREVGSFSECEWCVDFGTNLTGRLEFRLPENVVDGQEITITYTDRIVDGTPKELHQKDVVVASGRGSDSFCSRFNYRGFRYAMITGLMHEPEADCFTACLIHPAFESTSGFSCSHPLLNRIHDMLSYTLRCLSLGGYLVDCPHLERLGYGGDGLSSTRAACSAYDLQGLYANWHQAWLDCQQPDGDMPHTAPWPHMAGGGPIWCGFLLATSWFLYEIYGDRRVLERSYTSSRRWLDYVEKYVDDGILQPWPVNQLRNWCLGEWASPRRKEIDAEAESVGIVNNSFRIVCYDILSRTAAVLGHDDDARKYARTAEELRPLVHARFYHPETQSYAIGQQVDLAMPLYAGVPPPELRERVLLRLERIIREEKDGHLDVGLVGHFFLMQVLIDNDRQDLLLTMMTKTTFPGYGYMLENDATTTWEHWDGVRSHIHNCYNGTLLWFYRGLMGIRSLPEAPGFSRVLIKPAFLNGLDKVGGHQDTVRGRISVAWQRHDKHVGIDLTLPPGCGGVLVLPLDASPLAESGHEATEAEGVLAVERSGEEWHVELTSGSFRFTWQA